MALIHDPSRLNRRIEFDTVQPYRTSQGVSKNKLVPVFFCWCAVYVRTINQQYRLTGTELQDTITIIIRHNNQVSNKMKVNLDGKKYDIINITPDESSNPVSYDTLTLKEVNK